MDNLRTAGVIIIGDEVLKGQVMDSNSGFLSRRFHALGVRLRRISVIPDSVDEIAEEVSKFSKEYNIVVTTGGVGPTHDDVTYMGVAKAFGEKLVMHEMLAEYWKPYCRQGKLPGPIERMASVPESAVVTHAPVPKSMFSRGKFPIVSVSNVYIFPGVPAYVEAAFRSMEEDHFKAPSTRFYGTLVYLNVYESEAVDSLNKTVEAFKGKVEIGSYPVIDNPLCMTKITLESTSEKDTEEARSMLVSLLKGEWIVKDGNLIGNAVPNLANLIASRKLENFTDRLQQSIEVIDQCFSEREHSNVFLSFNGGKDCTALLHLVHFVLSKKYAGRQFPKLQAVYFRSKNPFPETEEFIEETAARYNLDLRVIPGPIKEALGVVLKEKPSLKAVLMGTRRSDPFSDHLSTFQETDAGWPKLLRVHPILDWKYQDVWKFLLELSIPYCDLYDQGKNKNLLKNALAILEEMEYILSVPFGPEGRGVLCEIKGSISISKCGYDILRKVYDESDCPITDSILNCARDINDHIGDGVKTFILHLTALIRGCVSQSNSLKIFRQLSSLKYNLESALNFCVPKVDELDFDSVVKSFFHTRLSINLYETMSSLFLEWVSKNRFIQNSYDYLFDNFDTLCTFIVSMNNFSESTVEKGVKIGGEFHGNFTLDKMKCTLKVIYISDCSESTEDDIASDLESLIREILISKVCKTTLLVTNAFISDSIRFRLRTLGVQFLHRISIDDAKFLMDYSLLYFSKNRCDIETEFRREELCHKTKLWFSLDVAQLIIYCPMSDFSALYRCTLKNCLKMCKVILEDKSPLVPSGRFENLFAKYFTLVLGNGNCIPASNRNELLNWIETKHEFEKKLRLLTLDVKTDENVVIVNDLELIIVNILKYLNKDSLVLDSEVIKIVCDSFMNVSRRIPVKYKFQALEPINIKFEIFSKALGLLLLLLNCNGVIRMKRSK